MFAFRKIWRALFSCKTRFAIRPLALLMTICRIGTALNAETRKTIFTNSLISMLLLTNKFKQDSKIPFFQMFLSVMIILTESITKPKKVICFVGLSADFWVYVVKLNSLKSLTVFLILLKQLRTISLATGNHLDILLTNDLVISKI